MHFLSTLLLTLAALFSLTSAVALQKSVIMTWPSDTPYHVIDQAKDAIVRAGGVITHEYHILK
jgi:hypothetical protein